MIRVASAKQRHGLVANVPPLPLAISYYDDFSDAYNQLSDPSDDQWKLFFDGSAATLDFAKFDVEVRAVVKAWCSMLLATNSPRTAECYCYELHRVPGDHIIGLLTSKPQEVKSFWNSLLTASITYQGLSSLKSLLSFLCNFEIGEWGPRWLDLASQLQLPKVDKYASVRLGDVFLTAAEEAEIVRGIDEECARIQTQGWSTPDEQLEETAILVCSYQFGLRPKQIAMLQVRNIRVWEDGMEEHSAVHLTFTMIKQRSSKQVFPMVRRLKRDWTPIFIGLLERARQHGMTGANRVFHRTPEQISKVVVDLTGSFGGRPRTPTELRHTAAQRLVDAGATEEELAAFMGHTDLNTGLVYFNSTPAQGARINQALGISKTYQTVIQIAHGRFIAPEELAELKGEQQIGGVPHGIPIAGIGGCSVGQPSCPYNPVTSCYGCNRFMPIAVAAIHQEVLDDLRGVMKLFYSTSHGERGSPAFQLESTISKVQAILNELGGEQNEPIA